MSIHDRLSELDYTATSDATNDYNCLGWALHDDENVWDPSIGAWPDEVARGFTSADVVELFVHYGFEICDSSQHENGFEKVALYHEEQIFRHAARQLENGSWTSKLGGEEDIEHERLDCLVPVYGEVYKILKRAI